MKAMTIAPDGTCTVIDLKPGLKPLQEAVGGFIEAVDLEDGIMWANEEGKLHGLDYNPHATYLSGIFRFGDFIVGTVVVTGPSDRNGDATPITDACIKRIKDVEAMR